MICVEKNHVVIKGNGVDLMAELTMAINHFRALLIEDGVPEETVDYLLDKIVETAKMTEEELEDESSELKAKSKKKQNNDDLFKRFFPF